MRHLGKNSLFCLNYLVYNVIFTYLSTIMMINYVVGDATYPLGDDMKHIVHICNDSGYWANWFVNALSKRWPEPKVDYLEWHRNNFASPPMKLGEIQVVDVDAQICVVNMIAQRGVFWGTKPPIRYDALRECLLKVAALNVESIHMPRIGCGLAGGSWDKIEAVINSVDFNATEIFCYDLT